MNKGTGGRFKVGTLVLDGGVQIHSGAGAPTDGTSGTGAAQAAIGSLYLDRTNGIAYINKGTLASPSWIPEGSEGGIQEIRNETGVQLDEDTPVYLSGWNETEKKFLVTKADADAGGTPAEYVIFADLATATNGVAVKVKRSKANKNTNGTTVGDEIYLSVTAGGFSLSAPTGADDLVQVIGKVAIVDATVGVIEYRLSRTEKIGTNEFMDLSVTTGKIAASAVDENKLATSVAGAGLTGGAGTALALVVDNSTVEVNVDTLRVKASGVTASELAINLPMTIALPFTLGNRGGAQADGVLVGRLTRQAVDAAIQEDNSLTSFVDETADANSAGANDTHLPDPEDTNDALYFGMTNKFSAVVINIGTSGVGDAVGAETAWEYSQGAAAWAALTEVTDDTTKLEAAPGAAVVSFLPPADWATDTVNTQGPFYFIRLRMTADNVYNTTRPQITQVWAQELIVGQGIVCPFTGTISAVDLSAVTASATNNDSEFLIINRTQGTFAQLTWTGADEIDRITGLTLAVTAGDELVVQMISEDGTTEFANGQMTLQINV